MKQSTIATEKGIIFKIMNAVRLGSCNDEKRRKGALRPYSIWCFQQYLLDGHSLRHIVPFQKVSSYRELTVCGNAFSIFNFTKMFCGLACSCFYTSHKQKKCGAVWRKAASCYGKGEALFHVIFLRTWNLRLRLPLHLRDLVTVNSCCVNLCFQETRRTYGFSVSFKSVDEDLWCDHSNESSLVALSHGSIYFLSSNKFCASGGNPMVWPKGKERYFCLLVIYWNG